MLDVKTSRNADHYSHHPAIEGIHSTGIGIFVNVVLALGKGVAGFLGHSFALVADAIESLADVLSSFVVYIGLKKAIMPPDADHPYGHGKFEPVAAVVVALSLFVAGIVIATESIHEIFTPHRSPAPFTLVVLTAVLLIKEGLFRYVRAVGDRLQSTAVKTDAWHHRADAITSALALIGISIALLGGRGYETADDWAALIASVIILYNAGRQLRPALAELTDAKVAPSLEFEVRRAAEAVPGVIDLEKCFVRKMGFDLYVDLHVVVDGGLSVRDGHQIAHDVKDAIRAANPKVANVLVHIEPQR